MNDELHKLFKKQRDEMFAFGERTGVLNERSRILTEIEKADLPVGVWPLIKNIIVPPKPKA